MAVGFYLHACYTDAMSSRKLLVTHHSPDLDAIASIWVLKRFDTQHYGDAKLDFVNPGEKLSDARQSELGLTETNIVHVDTGLGKFDHHQPDNGQKFISATSLVFDHVCQIHPEKQTDEALKTIVQYVTEIDHFREIYWPEADSLRYEFMLHQLIEGLSMVALHDDDSLVHFGMTCLDAIYTHLGQVLKARELITTMGQEFTIAQGKCLAIETENDDVIKLAQKQGYVLVVRKDQKMGNIRIKARPDSAIDLKPVADEIAKLDNVGTWYYHPSGKMLLNGSSKHTSQKPSRLSLSEVVAIIKEKYVK